MCSLKGFPSKNVKTNFVLKAAQTIYGQSNDSHKITKFTSRANYRFKMCFFVYYNSTISIIK